MSELDDWRDRLTNAHNAGYDQGLRDGLREGMRQIGLALSFPVAAGTVKLSGPFPLPLDEYERLVTLVKLCRTGLAQPDESGSLAAPLLLVEEETPNG